ncbi:hypothetical protein BOTBODRAFT_525703 [Botryobasidium botryosum FD-172 SS1]|uniref:Uncharacterized protein n=1 Tax=Botryobasidium botryosum (strain FD-172 SS1) TaxID=930990 RepID=A0A067MD99_BOTB1|nr:hypothetical protein BOTBODRAFT_525703 [Botryobasidium botryosum FD-172 SS1]
MCDPGAISSTCTNLGDQMSTYTVYLGLYPCLTVAVVAHTIILHLYVSCILLHVNLKDPSYAEHSLLQSLIGYTASTSTPNPPSSDTEVFRGCQYPTRPAPVIRRITTGHFKRIFRVIQSHPALSSTTLTTQPPL